MKVINNSILLDWKNAFAAGVAVAGGKGWNLARLDRYGFSVPAGGVLAAQAYLDFVLHNRMDERLQAAAREMDRLDPSGDRQMEISEEIRRLFMSGDVPGSMIEEIETRLAQWGLSDPPLAVRSSAVAEDSPSASFAGIHDSFLNVRGMEETLSAIKGCWASVWNPRAVAYRRRMDFSGVSSPPAVVIMAMVEAAASGVAFSCNPGSGREDQVLISANFGLGESVVGGSVDPDEYTVHVGFHSLHQSLVSKRTGRKEKKTVPSPGGGTSLEDSPGEGHRQALTDDDILRLSRLVRLVYCALGNFEEHQDVEWVFDGNEFHVVQARPVTAVPRYTYAGLMDQPTIWSNANFRDTLPMVIPPLCWSNMADALDTVLKSVMNAAGYPSLPGVSRKRLYQGRGYFNASVIMWENYDCFGSPPDRVNAMLGGHHPVIRTPDREPRSLLLGRIRRNLAFMKAAKRVRRSVEAQFEQLSERMRAARERDLKSVSDEGLLEFWLELEKAFRDIPDIHFALVGSAASYLMMTLLLERYIPGRGEAVANALLAGRETTTSAEHGYRLADLARIAADDPGARALLTGGDVEPSSWREVLPGSSPFKREFSAFLDDFGHRGVYEWDIRKPRWGEDQSWLLDVIRDNLSAMSAGGIENLRQRQRETADKAMQEAVSRIPFFLRPYLGKLLEGAGRETVQREMARSTLARVVGLGRVTALECGRRLADRGLLNEIDDVFFITWEEALSVLRGEDEGRGLITLVADRRAHHEELEKLTPPDFLEEDAPRRAMPETVSGGKALTGLGVAAGRAEGPARLIHQPAEGNRLLKGDVLVAPGTDPAWTPLFLRASALVMETGGIISHGAIVAREYGIPAVINVPGALQVLTEGASVTVDGDEGKVYLK
jgi:pyruvate,water dikinase